LAGFEELLEDVRRCAAGLLQEGFVEEVKAELAAGLALAPELITQQLGPGERPPTLEALFFQSRSWWVRRLAALALVHQGRLSSQALSTVHACLSEEGRVGVEAMLALTRWRVWPWARLGPEAVKRIRELAQQALALQPLAPRAAVAWMRASHGAAPEMEVLFALRLGLNRSDSEVRFECALCLQDEAGLLASLDSEDEGQVSAARRALAGLGSKRLLEQLAREGGPGFAKDVVAALHGSVPPEALEALLSASERGPDRLTEALLSLTAGLSFSEQSQKARARWSSWARAILGLMPGVSALAFLRWAALPPVAGQSMRAFLEGCAEAIEREEPEARAKSLAEGDFSRFLALAGPSEAALLNRWAREPGCGEPLAQALMTLTSRIQDWSEPAGQAARMLMAVWQGPGRELLLEPLGRAVREWSGIVGREELIDAVWQRFREHPEERAQLLAVFGPWRNELWERQLAAPNEAVARFEAWWRVDPEGFARQADLLMREVPVEELPQRVQCVLAAAEEEVVVRPWIASLGVFYAAAALDNAFRAGEDWLADEAERFIEWFPRFEQRVLATPAEVDRRAPQRPFLEEIHTELRLMSERLEVAREEAERQWQRELQQRVADSRRRDLERQARDLERAAAETLISRHIPPSELPPVPGLALRPRIDSKPIDGEVIFPGKPLPTLVDYVRLLKELGLGDPMKALASAGIDVATWAAVATAWGQAMMGRMELGLRFGELMAAPWE
jgi:hypothetical protein